jgi:two-component system, OmpR family, response regulator AdeR
LTTSALAEKKILIVEDEPEIAEILDAFFEREGAQRLVSRDGEDALAALRYWRPDLMVLDLKLPKRDGFSVLADARARGGPPVIVVTALGEDVDKLAGFRLGCDDYLVKPFNPLELIARAKAVLRRPEQAGAPAHIQFGKLRIDLEAHTAAIGGIPLTLTPTEFRLLRLLAERGGRLVSRGQLVEAALDDDAFDKSVNPHMSRLRQKLQEQSPTGRGGAVRVASVRSEGYRLEIFE